MFAVIKTGGKQYRVAENDEIRVESLKGDAGTLVEINEVMMVGDTVGTPFVDGALVSAEIVEHGRARKVIAFKKRRRQNSRRKIGHRQGFTLLRISEILTDGKKASKKATGAGPTSRSTGETRIFGTAAAGALAAASTVADTVTDAAPKAKKAAKAATKAVKETVEDATETLGEVLEDAASIATGSAATKEQDGPLFTAPAGEKDKLTKIKGIGPVAERQLNEQGITTYRQIAELSDEDIQRVDDYMPFSSAQIRDWQGQAKDML